MKNINVQYSFTNKDFRRRLLRHIRIIYFITVPLTIGFSTTWIIASLNAYKNSTVVIIAFIITIILFIINACCLYCYQILFRNRLITARNFTYTHYVNIENDYLKLTLESPDKYNSEHYEFKIKKIKKENDTYIIYKNNNNFIYLPAKYVDEN